MSRKISWLIRSSTAQRHRYIMVDPCHAQLVPEVMAEGMEAGARRDEAKKRFAVGIDPSLEKKRAS